MFGADTFGRHRQCRLVLSHDDLLGAVRRLRETGATTNAALGRLLNLPSSRIAEIFDEKRRISVDEAKAIVEHFEIGGGAALPAPAAASDDETAEVRRIDLGYASGPGTNIDNYVEEGTVRFDLAWLKSITRARTDMLFVARGDGDSMSPTLINDDTVLIDTSQRELNLNDRIWAVSVCGAGMIKRIRMIAADRVAVLSDKKGVPPQEVSIDDLHIVGRIVWVGRRV